MSREKFDPNCPGCRPAMIDLSSGEAMRPDHPMMMALMTVWSATSERDKVSYHNVMCNNSRLPSDLRAVKQITDRMKRVCDRIPEEPTAKN